jgi:hypothetical protein
MPPPNYVELVKLYARRGIADWKSAPEDVRRRARKCLGTRIADNPSHADVMIYRMYSGKSVDSPLFIPMPKHPDNGIERSFFLPVTKPGAAPVVGFELLLLVQGANSLAFRFEPADDETSAHNYGHFQLNRQLLYKTIEVPEIPTWLPDSYPAFPILTSEPLRVFLYMATAVHGYHTGVVKVLQDIFQKASRASELASYLDELEDMLC